MARAHHRRGPTGLAAAFVAAATGVAISGAADAQPAGFHVVGPAPGTTGTRVYGISADGRTAAGYSLLANSNDFPGFTWTAAAGRNDFGRESGVPSLTFAYGISGDGTTAVGAALAETGSPETAFRYRGPGTFQSLGTVPQYGESRAFGVSGDGSVIVGSAERPGRIQAFRWTPAGGMQGIGYTNNGHFFSEAYAVSRDGGTIVGRSTDFVDGEAFVWTEGAGMEALPHLPGLTTTLARGVNFDGTIIVGESGARPTRWLNGQVVDLGVASGVARAAAYAVNDDGTVIVGDSTRDGVGLASVWTPSRGAELLADYLAAFGVAVPPDLSLTKCYAVSADGRTFAGYGVSASGSGVRGYVATVPTPGGITMAALVGFVAVGRRRMLRRTPCTLLFERAAPCSSSAPSR